MKKKEQTCKYNLNRHASKIAYPFCIYGEKLNMNIQLPPHLYFESISWDHANRSLCTHCKCYEKAEDKK